MQKKAFTLIELLIVVAIIAILAAIAIPNFLEAQTRSKVSRTKADMRSLKLSLEAYRVDNNTYPDGRDCNNLWMAGYPEGAVQYRLVLLTTPIAYITSLPDDVFLTLSNQTVACDKEGSFKYLLRKYHTVVFGANKDAYWVLGGGAPGNFTNSRDPNWVYWTPGLNPEWIIFSEGPQRLDRLSADVQNCNAIPYDPTNGTMSYGEIVTYGP